MNYIKMPRSSRKRVAVQSFSRGMDASQDESILAFSVAARIENFDFSDGALREGYGLSYYHLDNETAANGWLYRRHDFDTGSDEEILMWANLSGRIFFKRQGGSAAEELEGAIFTSTPRAVNYRLYGDDVILICSATDPMLVWDGKNRESFYWVTNAPQITSMTLHYERMFCTVSGERNAVWFSDDLDPTNWDMELDRGGFVQLIDDRGKSNKVISFLNYLYVFRDYGISRMTAFADQSDFSVVNLFVSSGKIYPDSITVCGDRILFLAQDGLYCFDGLSTRKVLSVLAPAVCPSPKAFGVFFSGQYYLSLCMETAAGERPGGGENNTLLVYDPKTGMYSLLTDVCLNALFSGYDDGMLHAVASPLWMHAATYQCFSVEKSGRIGTVTAGIPGYIPTVKRWTGGFSDLGTENVKTVREIHIESDDVFTLTVESERAKKEFTVMPEGPGIQRIRVNLSGRKICVSITANTEKARITRPSLIFSQRR